MTARRDELIAELRSLDTSVMDTWDRDQLEREYLVASESLGWCEHYMREWERGCDQDKATLEIVVRRQGVALGVLAMSMLLLVVALIGVTR